MTDVTVVALGPDPAGGPPLPPGAVPADEHGGWAQAVTTPLVAFVRPGDRFRPGKLERQAAVLAARPATVLVFTSYALNDAGGRLTEVVRDGREARSGGAGVLLSRPLEASTVMVRAEALGAVTGWPVLGQPGGDTACWAELAEVGRLEGVDEVLADVVLDRTRHGLDAGPELARLATLLASPACGGEVASVLRRRALRRRYIDLEVPGARLPGPGRVVRPRARGREDFPVGDEHDATVRDLEWALERQAERFSADLAAWANPEGPVPELALRWPDAELAAREEEVHDLTRQLSDAGKTIAALERKAGHLERQVKALEGQLRRARSSEKGRGE
ncbi:MAG: hypothetical protein AB1673_07615 [Actinomycetota bacterium]